jgi:predicted Zn-dependent peptidase
VRTPELWIAWAAPGATGADRSSYLGSMWASLVGGNFERGRLDDLDVADVSFDSYSEALATVFTCRVRLTEGAHPEKSLRVVLEALPWVGGDEMFLERRFEHLKLGALRELAYSAESIKHRSLERASFAHFEGSLGYYGTTVAKIQAIGAGKARAFAERYLAPGRARAVLLEPLADKQLAGDRVRPGDETAAAPEHAPLPPATVEHLAAVRHLAGMRAVDLPNGMRVVIVPRPGAPVTTAALGFAGGEVSAPPGAVEASHASLLFHFEEAPGDFGIGFGFWHEPSVTTMRMRAGAANLDRALDMMSFALRGYDVDWPSDKWRETRLPLLVRQYGSPVATFERSYRAALFHGHPYGLVPPPEQTARLTKSEVERWLDGLLTPRNALLVVVGDVSPAEAEAAARDALGSWGRKGDRVPPPPPLPVPGLARAAVPAALASPAAFRVTNRPGATQAEVRLGCLLSPDDPETDVVYTIAAEMSEVALGTRLRGRTGSTYGVHAWVAPLRGGAAWLQMESVIDNGKLPTALAAVRAYWTGVATAGVNEHGVEVARGELAAGWLLAFEQSEVLAGSLLRRWSLGWPLESLDQNARYLGQAHAGAVSAALAACARGMTAAVLGDERVIRAALTAGGDGAL